MPNGHPSDIAAELSSDNRRLRLEANAHHRLAAAYKGLAYALESALECYKSGVKPPEAKWNAILMAKVDVEETIAKHKEFMP